MASNIMEIITKILYDNLHNRGFIFSDNIHYVCIRCMHWLSGLCISFSMPPELNTTSVPVYELSLKYNNAKIFIDKMGYNKDNDYKHFSAIRSVIDEIIRLSHYDISYSELQEALIESRLNYSFLNSYDETLVMLFRSLIN
jgi:hypothetical protein